MRSILSNIASYILLHNEVITMAKNCAACRKAITTTNCIECFKCKEAYHLLCVNIKEKSTILDWICPGCQCRLAKKGNLDSPARASLTADDSNDKVTLRPQNRKVPSPCNSGTGSHELDAITTLTSEIRLLRKDMGEMKQHLKSLSDCVTKCCSSLDEFEARLVKTESKIKALEKQDIEIFHLKQRVNQLEEQLNNQAQSKAQNEIEILGINEMPKENVIHIALCVAMKIGIKLKEEDLDLVTRAGPRRQSGEYDPKEPVSRTPKPRPLIIRVLRRQKCDEFLKAAKSRRNLTTADIDVAGPAQKFFINERLTKANRLLFRDARIRSRKAGYKYCWTRSGSIFIRKDQGSNAIAIRRPADLDQCCDLVSGVDEENARDNLQPV